MSNGKIKIEIPDVDTASGLNLCDDDFDIYINSLRIFVSKIPASLEKLRIVSAETINNYAVCVHGVKGMSQYVGAEEVRKMALDLEKKAKASDIDGVLAENDKFILYTEKILSNINNWLITHDNSCK